MNTFRLKNGIIKLEENTLLIEGGKPRLVKWLTLLVALAWSLFFVYRGYLHYRLFSVTNNSLQLTFLIASLMALGFWAWVAGQSLSITGLSQIPLTQISSVQKVYSPSKEVPLVTLHLKDNRKQALEFKDVDDLHFTDALASRGIPVTE